MTNAIRHAQARHCTVRLVLTGDRGLETGNESQGTLLPGPRSPVPSLQLEISDDGIGLPTEHHAGIGLTSMRERATELGGEFHVESITPHGTRVSVCLPLPRE
ncbi:MAG: hypothetical protein HYR94_07800 [Chloroflexi bacterium]|nr:hypothetical protein [Chloroflexota bacterium]